jgi:hypothetical protein
MKYWLNTQFNESAGNIDLLSIGLVAEDGREFYGLNYDADFRKAALNGFVRDRVLPVLPYRPESLYAVVSPIWFAKKSLGLEVAKFLGCISDGEHKPYLPEGIDRPEIWTWYGAYHWVAMCSLFGSMVELPNGLPMLPYDAKQWCDQLGNPRIVAQSPGCYHALENARQLRNGWHRLRDISMDVDVDMGAQHD